MKITPIMNHQYASFQAGFQKAQPAIFKVASNLSKDADTTAQAEMLCISIAQQFGRALTREELEELKRSGTFAFFERLAQRNAMKPLAATLVPQAKIPIKNVVRHLSVQESAQLASAWEEFLKSEITAQKKRRILSVQEQNMIREQIKAQSQLQEAVVNRKDIDAQVAAAQTMEETIGQYISNPQLIAYLVNIFNDTSHADRAYQYVILNSLELKNLSDSMKKVKQSILNYMRTILEVQTKDHVTRKNKAADNSDYISAITAIELGITNAILKTPFFHHDITDPQKASLTKSLQNAVKSRLEEANINRIRIAYLAGVDEKNIIIKSYYEAFIPTLVERYKLNVKGVKVAEELGKNFTNELKLYKKNSKRVIQRTWGYKKTYQY